MAKAGRPKKGSAGLPAWFDIEKYRPTKSFHAAEWFEQLAFRSFAASWYEDEDSPIYLGDEWEELLTSDPIITRSRIERHYPLEPWQDEGFANRRLLAEKMQYSVFLDANRA